MRFTWKGLLLAPLVVPVLLSAGLLGLLSGGWPALGFLILLVPGCVISYITTIFLFLPCLFLLSRLWVMTGVTVCLLGLVLGAAMHVPITFVVWGSSSPDSGPPVESFLPFFMHWSADPLTAIFPVAGLITAGAYWRLGRQRVPNG
jgi:hypothetical protein